MSKMVTVKFPDLGKTLSIDEESNVAQACELIGEPLNQVCGGKGKCKKCTVDIMVDGEIKTVLGCQTKVSEGLEIRIKGLETSAQILTTNMIKDIEPDPSLKIIKIKHDDLKTPLGESDWETLIKAVKVDLHKPELFILRKLSELFHDESGIKLVVYDEIILDVLSGKDEDTIYGVAFDIGTTTDVGYLYDMMTYKLIGVSSRLNKQTTVGGDVISRIEYTINNEEGLEKLNNLIMETINEILDNICSEHNIDKNRIYQGSFCGNSTMQHLFLGLKPQYLGLLPFSSTTHDMVFSRARETKVDINPLGAITFLPLLGGHVGADTAAVLLSVQNDDKYRLVIDLGTNGQVGVGANYNYKVCSMASGPALEGYGLTHGMRGTNGAIERVRVENGNIHFKVIGNSKPLGICGSGIIDLLAELLRTDIIRTSGALVDPEDIVEEKLKERLVRINDQKCFIVATKEQSGNDEAIYITQRDIRQIQLAIAAIYTGCMMLVEESGIKGDDIAEILLAGAFGNYIDVEKAQYIGMIPYFKNVPVFSIGNAAGTGCQLFLLSKSDKDECQLISENAVHVEIATNPKFTENFMNNTSLDKIER